MTPGLYEVVWPKSTLGVKSVSLANRLDSLDGARVAFLWDYVFRGDELFVHLGKRLGERVASIEVVHYEEFGNTHGSDEKAMISALPAKLRDRGVDAVVSGIGC